MKNKYIEWALRLGVAGEFLGHGMFALQGKEGWFKYFEPFGINDPAVIVKILLVVGIVDIILAFWVLLKPVKPILLWMFIWGTFTALLRWPIGPDPIWDFFERWANWGAPLALYFMYGGTLFMKNRGKS